MPYAFFSDSLQALNQATKPRPMCAPAPVITFSEWHLGYDHSLCLGFNIRFAICFYCRQQSRLSGKSRNSILCVHFTSPILVRFNGQSKCMWANGFMFANRLLLQNGWRTQKACHHNWLLTYTDHPATRRN